MNILFLALDVNIKNKTGDAVHVQELALSLAKLGNEVSLVAPYTDDNSEELISLLNHKNIHLFFNKPGRYFRNLSTILFCRKIAKSHDSKIIYERRFSPKTGFALNKILKIPFIVEINGLKDKEMELQNMPEKSNIIPRKMKKWIWRNFFKSVGRIVTVSYGLKKALSEEYGLHSEKIIVIFNGANIELFKPMDRNKCLEELGLNTKFRYIGFIGSLAPWQGVDQLIKIAPMILEKIPEARFLIVGDGILRRELEGLADKLDIRDRIIFTGFVPYEIVPKYINTFEVCVAPFSGIERNVKYSFSAIKLYEYMACGKPIVTTNVCGIKDEIKKLGLGKVVRADDLEGLTSSIVELLEDQQLKTMLGEKGRNWVSKEHSWKNVAERVVKVCEDVLSDISLV
ncbi:MAG: glycosyltransferase family 4 protein [Candidatus Heimdallarchaeota archaeon]|nr:MAG: glycosyltransferase family 4 protein [Candidatus Heimdallarchaeota archaeon]